MQSLTTPHVQSEPSANKSGPINPSQRILSRLPCLLVKRETRKYNINECSDNIKPVFKNALLLAYVRAGSKSMLASLFFILC
jgi:hypothetical protein